MAGGKKSEVRNNEIRTEVQDESKGKMKSALEHVRTVRRINPLGMRVVIRLKKEGNQTATGLYLPEGAKESTQESFLGEVIEVASAMDDDTQEEANISGVPLGALVLIPRRAGVKVPWDEELRIVETKEILAVVNEVNLS